MPIEIGGLGLDPLIIGYIIGAYRAFVAVFLGVFLSKAIRFLGERRLFIYAISCCGVRIVPDNQPLRQAFRSDEECVGWYRWNAVFDGDFGHGLWLVFLSFGDRRPRLNCLRVPRLYLHDRHLSFSEQGIPWNNQRSFTNDCVGCPYDRPSSSGVAVFVLSRTSPPRRLCSLCRAFCLVMLCSPLGI